ncbi:ATP-binding cassette domain-containing protein [Yimella radicis]
MQPGCHLHAELLMDRLVGLDDVSFGYGRSKKLALSDVTLDLYPGVTGLVGLNGAGKSTLLHLIAGILRPKSGTVEWESDTNSPRVSLLPQATRMPRGFTVRQFLEYGAWLQGASPGQAAHLVPGALDLVGLQGYEARRCTSLSGGEQRRLAFANSISRRPSVLLLDEPTTGLDPDQRIRMRKAIAAVEESSAVLISSHLIEDILAVANRIVIIRSGRVTMDSPTDGVLELLADSGGADREEAFVRLLDAEKV